MNLLIISPASLRTRPESYGGMEFMAFNLMRGLETLGHNVDLAARLDSDLPVRGKLIPYSDEKELPDIFNGQFNHYQCGIDLTHDKTLSMAYPDWPIICNFQVMSVSHTNGINPVFISHGQKRTKFPNVEGPVIHYGLNFDEYPLYEDERDNYILYLGQIIPEKRVEWACQVAIETNTPLKAYGPQWCPPWYRDALRQYEEEFPELISINDSVGGQEKLELLQKATMLIHPIGAMDWCEAGAICALESLATGTPVLSTSNGCMPEYIISGVNGWMGNSVDRLSSLLLDYKIMVQSNESPITPRGCRESIEQEYNYIRFAKEYVDLAQKVANGLRWNVR